MLHKTTMGLVAVLMLIIFAGGVLEQEPGFSEIENRAFGYIYSFLFLCKPAFQLYSLLKLKTAISKNAIIEFMTKFDLISFQNREPMCGPLIPSTFGIISAQS